MSGKFMRLKRIAVPVISLVIMASQLSGCAAASQSELLQMINKGESISIEVMAPISEEQGTETVIVWEELASLTTNPEMRKAWDDILAITKNDTGKNGILYVNDKGENEPNNTLHMAIHNREFQKVLEEKTTLLKLSESVENQYIDMDNDNEKKSVYMGINGYFNILPDTEQGYCNADSTLSRCEFMAAVFRAETPVKDLTEDKNFTQAVGDNELNIYAQGVADSSYLDITSKSLNNMTFNGTITRAEAVYLLVSRYFSDDVKNADIKGTTFSDAKDGGNIAQDQKFIEDNNTKDYWKSYELTHALSNPDKGLPTDLYKVLVVAKEKGIIASDETRWDEGLTKLEAIEMLVNTYLADNSISTFNYKNGTVEGYSDEEVQYNEEGEAVAEKSDMDSVINQTDENMEEPVVEDAAPVTEETTDFEIESLSPTTLYAIQNVNLRQGPDSKDFAKTGSLSSREQVTVTGVVKQYKGNDTLWYQLESGEFVAGSYLVETLPPQQTTPPSTDNKSEISENTQTNPQSNNNGGLKFDASKSSGGFASGQTSGQATAEGDGNRVAEGINIQ